MQDHGKGQGFKKHAVAAIDAQTMECCLRVHGQVVGLIAKFHFTGEPRYADYLDAPRSISAAALPRSCTSPSMTMA